LEADSNIPRPYTDQPFERDLASLLSSLQVKCGRHARLVLLMDGAEVLASYPLQVHAALRRILSSAAGQGLVIILAGVDSLNQQPQTEHPSMDVNGPPKEANTSFFYNTFLNLPIPRLSPEESLRLIREPVAGAFQYEPEALEHILVATQGRPAEIQGLCRQLIGELLASGEQVVTARQVQEALQARSSPRSELLTQTESLLNEILDWLESNPDATNPQVEERLRRTWTGLQKAIVQQVIMLRKMGKQPPSGTPAPLPGER
jgi:hypothetical protein